MRGRTSNITILNVCSLRKTRAEASQQITVPHGILPSSAPQHHMDIQYIYIDVTIIDNIVPWGKRLGFEAMILISYFAER